MNRMRQDGLFLVFVVDFDKITGPLLALADAGTTIESGVIATLVDGWLKDHLDMVACFELGKVSCERNLTLLAPALHQEVARTSARGVKTSGHTPQELASV